MSGTERLLDVLTIVITAEEPMTARRIGEAAGMPLSSAYRHLSLLKERGFIEDLGRDIGFGPGPLALRMALHLDHYARIRELALPQMQKLNRETCECIALMRAVGMEVLCVEMLESTRSLRCSFTKGRSQPLSHGASAKALLAHLDAPLRKRIIAETLGSDPAAHAALEAALETVRIDGYAESDGEVDEGVWGVSVPIFSNENRLEGSISLMAPANRIAANREAFIALTATAAANISDLLKDFGETQDE